MSDQPTPAHRPQHTPGPWTVDALGLHVTAPNEAMRICDIRGWGHLTGIGGLRLSEKDAEAVQRANASLIAAAPDLLAALKAIRIDANRLCDRQLGGSYEDDCRKAIATADAAIAKAEGR